MKRAQTLDSSVLFANDPNSPQENHFDSSFVRLKPGTKIQFRPKYPASKTDDSNTDGNDNDTNDIWFDAYFWKFVKIVNQPHPRLTHKRSATLDFGSTNVHDSNNAKVSKDNKTSKDECKQTTMTNGSDHNAASEMVRAVCTRDRDLSNPDLGYIVFELPLDLNYFRLNMIATASRSISASNLSNNSSECSSPRSVESTQSARSVFGASLRGQLERSQQQSGHARGRKKYPKIGNKQLASWTVNDVKLWMQQVCKMTHLSDLKKLEKRDINGMKLIKCCFNHKNNNKSDLRFSVQSIQILIGLTDVSLSRKIYSKLNDLIARQKEIIRINSIPFNHLYKYVMDPMKTMVPHRMKRRNSIMRSISDRDSVRRTLSRMDTSLRRMISNETESTECDLELEEKQNIVVDEPVSRVSQECHSPSNDLNDSDHSKIKKMAKPTKNAKNRKTDGTASTVAVTASSHKIGNSGTGHTKGRRGCNGKCSNNTHKRGKTWNTVKDVFNEDLSGKSKKFEAKKQLLKQINAGNDNNIVAGVPDIDREFVAPSYMKEYEDRLLKEQKKHKKGIHSKNVYENNDKNYYYRSSCVHMDTTKINKFIKKRDLKNGTNNELWNDPPPVSYHGYVKWLQKLENAINKQEETQQQT